jgi:hypothetical protein
VDGEVTPGRLIAFSDEDLRAAGRSAAKTVSLRDLAAKVLDRAVILDPRKIARKAMPRSSSGSPQYAASAGGRRDLPAVPPAAAGRMARRRPGRTARARACLAISRALNASPCRRLRDGAPAFAGHLGKHPAWPRLSA